MRRVVHELGELAQRFGRLAEQLDEEAEATQAVWRDQRGQAFLREHVAPFKPNVSLLVASINESRELFEDLARRLSDPDKHH
ncbi:MAG: hypothetical protein ACTHOU_09140 [Aureliella sp.]|jgi:hypothetical protein